MDKQIFTGKTLDDAIAQAAKAFRIERSLVAYDVVPTENGGLFSKLFNRGVKIEAWVEADTCDLQAAAREAVLSVITQGNARGGNEERGARSNGKGPHDGRGEARAKIGNDRGVRKETRGAQNEKGPRPRLADAVARGGPRQSNESRRDNDARRDPRNPREPHDTRKREVRAPRDGSHTEGSAGHPTPPRDEHRGEEARPPVEGLTFEAPGVRATLDEVASHFLVAFAVPADKSRFEAQEGGDLLLQIEDAFLESELSKTDRLGLAFEHVFKRIAQKRHGDVASRVTLNAGLAHERRAEKLRVMALDLAEKVKTSGKSITLGAKSPQERRIIHLSLDGFEGVGTRSVGSGENRKLVIYSTETPGRGTSQGTAKHERQGHERQGREGQGREGQGREGQGRRGRRGRGGQGGSGGSGGQGGPRSAPSEAGSGEPTGTPDGVAARSGAAVEGEASSHRGKRRRGRRGTRAGASAGSEGSSEGNGSERNTEERRRGDSSEFRRDVTADGL